MASELVALRELIATVGVVGFVLIMLAIIVYLIVNSKTRQFNEMTSAQEVLRKSFQSQQTEIAKLRGEIDTMQEEREKTRLAREAERQTEADARATLAKDFQDKLDKQAEEIKGMRDDKLQNESRHLREIAALNEQIVLLREERDAAVLARDAAFTARDQSLNELRAKDATLHERDNEITRLNSKISELDKQVAQLEGRVKELEHPRIEPPPIAVDATTTATPPPDAARIDPPAPAEKASDHAE